MRTTNITNYGFNAFLFGYLIMVNGCIYSIFTPSADNLPYNQKAGESLAYQLIWLALYLLLICKLIQKGATVVNLVLGSRFFLALLVSATLSYLVNGADPLTLAKFGMYVMTVMFAAWITTIDRVDEIFKCLFQVGLIVLIMHFIAYPFLGDVSYDSLNRTTIFGTKMYGGLFGHKQLAGAFFGMNFLISAMMFFSDKKKKWFVFLITILNMLALLLSGSGGPLLSVAGAVLITVGIWLIILRKNDLATIYWTIATFGALIVLIVGPSNIFELIGRDATASGRDFLLSVWPSFFLEHPWLGYGYAGFFTGLPNAPAIRLWAITPYQAHIVTFESSYLEAFISFGLIGGLLFVTIVLTAIVNAVRFATRSDSKYKYGPLLLVMFIIISAISDTTLMLHNHIFVVIVFWVYFGLEKSFLKRMFFVRSLAWRYRHS